MRFLIGAVLALLMTTGCNAQTAMPFEAMAQVVEEPAAAALDTNAAVYALSAVNKTIWDGWHLNNGRFVCQTQTLNYGARYSIEIADADGGPAGYLQVSFPEAQQPGLVLTCHEGVVSETEAHAIGTCTTLAMWQGLAAGVMLARWDFEWTRLDYQQVNGFYQWYVEYGDGMSAFWTLPDSSNLRLPCAEPPYWDPPTASIRSKRELEERQ